LPDGFDTVDEPLHAALVRHQALLRRRYSKFRHALQEAVEQKTAVIKERQAAVAELGEQAVQLHLPNLCYAGFCLPCGPPSRTAYLPSRCRTRPLSRPGRRPRPPNPRNLTSDGDGPAASPAMSRWPRRTHRLGQSPCRGAMPHPRTAASARWCFCAPGSNFRTAATRRPERRRACASYPFTGTAEGRGFFNRPIAPTYRVCRYVFSLAKLEVGSNSRSL
jgi:hypothetical protein